MVHLAVLCRHCKASTHEFPIYYIFIGERSFLGLGHMALALQDNAAIGEADVTLPRHVLSK